jgi:biopolymer transport protein ExbB
MKKVLLAMTVIGAIVVTAAAAYAAEDELAMKMTVMTLIGKSGIIGIFIILLSFVGLALIIEHAVTIRRDKLLPHYFVVELEELFENEEYEEALQLCESEDNLLSRVVGAGLAKVDRGYEVMEEGMAEAAEESSMTLQHKISYVSLISAIAPMLGLLGTVVGMVISFAVLAEKGGAANPTDLAEGISMALMTTVMGLIVAIPLMGVYHFFRNKVTRLDMETGVIAGDLMQRFRPAQKAAS